MDLGISSQRELNILGRVIDCYRNKRSPAILLYIGNGRRTTGLTAVGPARPDGGEWAMGRLGGGPYGGRAPGSKRVDSSCLFHGMNRTSC